MQLLSIREQLFKKEVSFREHMLRKLGSQCVSPGEEEDPVEEDEYEEEYREECQKYQIRE